MIFQKQLLGVSVQSLDGGAGMSGGTQPQERTPRVGEGAERDTVRVGTHDSP